MSCNVYSCSIEIIKEQWLELSELCLDYLIYALNCLLWLIIMPEGTFLT